MAPMNAFPLLLLLHVTSAAVWVGGMFFAYQCLRPAAAQLLAPPERLRLWQAVLARFFAWVWLAVFLIPASGLATILAIGMRNAPLHWHLMLLTGSAMIVIFLGVFFLPYRALVRAVAAEDWPSGAIALGRIRRLVGVNLLLGLLTIAIATAGRLLG
jgi:uncharacterized membrane protein